ncbi:MAG: DUF805 domain-containing protein [Sulfitobacter sp.]
MQNFLSNYENFAFRAFNFKNRATTIEYWLVMPLLWGLLFYTLVGDVNEVNVYLLAKQIPPMNPLYYESSILFLLTFIPRMSLTMRRLHDRDRTGFWAILPMITFISVCVMLAALTGAMMNSTLTGPSNSPDSFKGAFDTLIQAAAPGGNFWPEMFKIADVFHTKGNEAVWGLLSEIYGHNGAVDIRRSGSNVITAIEGDTGHTVGLVTVTIGLVMTPIVTGMLHVLFMVLPSSPYDNYYGPAEVIELKYKKVVDGKHNPMAGYAYLYEKTDDEKAQQREVAQAEVKALYRSRVLGQADTG